MAKFKPIRQEGSSPDLDESNNNGIVQNPIAAYTNMTAMVVTYLLKFIELNSCLIVKTRLFAARPPIKNLRKNFPWG